MNKADEKVRNFFVMRALVFLIVVLIGAAGYFIWNLYQISQIDSFDECAARYPVMESYPAQCRANGQTFVDKY